MKWAAIVIALLVAACSGKPVVRRDAAPSPSPAPVAISVDAPPPLAPDAARPPAEESDADKRKPIEAAPPVPHGHSPDLALQVAELRASGDATPVGANDGGDAAVARVAIVRATTAPETTLSTAKVTRKIAAVYLPQLARCYRTRLESDASLRGTETLAFSVGDTARATDATATGPDARVDTCMAAAVGGWRFSVPKTADGAAATTRVTVTLSLSAS